MVWLNTQAYVVTETVPTAPVAATPETKDLYKTDI